MALLPRAQDDAPLAPVSRLELGLAVALLVAVLVAAALLVPALG